MHRCEPWTDLAEVLLDDYAHKLDENGCHDHDRARAGPVRMGNLIDEILQLSRLSRRGFERVPADMSALAREIAAELNEAEPDRPVEVEVEDGLLAQADLALVRTVLKTCPVGADVLTSRSDRQARRRLPTDRERPSVRRSRRPLESKVWGRCTLPLATQAMKRPV